VFGTTDAKQRLGELGANCRLENETEDDDVDAQRREEIVEAVRERLRRFYLPGKEGYAGSRWDSNIQEKNLLGGVGPTQVKFIKSRVIPALLKEGMLNRRREHGLVVYELTNHTEDSARALLERGELTGAVESVVERLQLRLQ
jgi:hypothetical protein